MTREQKTQLIDNLTARISERGAVYVADISTLNAIQTADLRSKCFKSEVSLSVVKNTLLVRAMDQSERDFGELPAVLKGSSCIFVSDVANAPAKIIKEFRKKTDRPILKGAYVEEAIYIGDGQIESLVNIKSKDELIGDILALLQSPAKAVISSLQSGGQKISGIVKTLSER